MVYADDKFSIMTIYVVNFVWISSEAGMRQHKFTWIAIIKSFAIKLSSINTANSWPPHNFSTCVFFMGAHHFWHLGYFWIDTVKFSTVLITLNFYKFHIVVLTQFLSSKKRMGDQRGTKVAPWCKHCSSCCWWKGTSQDEATLIREETKSLTPAVLELCLSEGISK